MSEQSTNADAREEMFPPACLHTYVEKTTATWHANNKVKVKYSVQAAQLEY